MSRDAPFSLFARPIRSGLKNVARAHHLFRSTASAVSREISVKDGPILLVIGLRFRMDLCPGHKVKIGPSPVGLQIDFAHRVVLGCNKGSFNLLDSER